MRTVNYIITRTWRHKRNDFHNTGRPLRKRGREHNIFKCNLFSRAVRSRCVPALNWQPRYRRTVRFLQLKCYWLSCRCPLQKSRADDDDAIGNTKHDRIRHVFHTLIRHLAYIVCARNSYTQTHAHSFTTTLHSTTTSVCCYSECVQQAVM